MNISKQWKAAAAGLLALALVGGSSVAANAAPGDPLNPQPNGSDGVLHIFDGQTGDPIVDPNHVFHKYDEIITAGSATDYNVRQLPFDASKVATATATYSFISSAANLRGAGRNSWEAYGTAVPFNPASNGVFMGNVTPGGNGNANGIGQDGVFNDVGGTYLMGMAFTKNSGVTIDAIIYREMTILPDGEYTLAPIEVEGAATIGDPTEADLLPGLEIANLASTTVDSTIVNIDAGVAFANQTVQVGAFSVYVDLGQVTLDANGQGSVDTAGSGLTPGAPHNLVIWDPSNGDVLGWGGFTLQTTTPTFATDSVDLTATVSASDRFELIAPAASVDLGAAGRNVETTPVSMGGFKVIDDRYNLLGWDVNASALAFTSGANTIGADALGYAISRVGTNGGAATIGTDKVAGVAGFGIVASGAALTSTTETGADFDLDLSFKSPIDAATGTYGSTLTLDLVSR